MIGGTRGRFVGEQLIGSAATAIREITGFGLRLVAGTKRYPTPGEPAGIDHLKEISAAPDPESITITCIDYSSEREETQRVDDLDNFLALERPHWSEVRWLDVGGLHPHVVAQFRENFGFHTLAAEDVIHIPQRPRVEAYPNHLFLVLRMFRIEEGALVSEQVSLFLTDKTIITFQERSKDVWDPVRIRIHTENSRIRQRGASFLLYALLDAIIDHSFPVLERYGDRLEEIEELLFAQPTTVILHQLHAIKRELSILRRVLWPTRELVDQLQRGEQPEIHEEVRAYLRDVYSHTVQVLDIIEMQRDMAGGLVELYMSSVSNRMNEVMKVLTIMASLFIPITFLAGVYGMNFERIPGLKFKYAYEVFWGVCLTVVSGLLVYFRRKRWL